MRCQDFMQQIAAYCNTRYWRVFELLN